MRIGCHFFTHVALLFLAAAAGAIGVGGACAGSGSSASSPSKNGSGGYLSEGSGGGGFSKSDLGNSSIGTGDGTPQQGSRKIDPRFDPDGTVMLDQRAARTGVERGDFRPLAQILDTVQKSAQGTVVAVDLAKAWTGQVYYRVVVVSGTGQYWQVTVDAKRNAVLDVRRH